MTMKIDKTGLLAALVLLCAGCSSPLFNDTIFDQREYRRTGGPAKQLAKIRTDSEMTNLECQRLSEQIDALNRNQQQLDTRLRNIESRIDGSPDLDQDIIALRRDIEQLRVEREQLRKEITDDLAGRIEKIAAKQRKAVDAARRQVVSRPANTSSAASSVSGYEHKVERGQTLSEIARGYNTTVKKIIDANNIKNPSNIRVGQVLFIPD
ncbi:MAG: LysM peptidoglycan-binding domain-containing protein [Kiritimatiellia bacterium]